MTLNLLVAYPYFDPKMAPLIRTFGRERLCLMVDSGAFTAWNAGKEITVPQFCEFLDSIEDVKPDFVVQLDVIGDHTGSLRNLEAMYARGHKALPVFTRGGDKALLDYLYTFSDYILLGGVAKGHKRFEFLKWVLAMNEGRRAHWLGFTNMDFIKRYTPTSCDSSWWNSGARYGQIPVYMGNGKLGTFKRSAFDDGMRKYRADLLRTGLTPNEVALLQHPESWKGNDAAGLQFEDGYLLRPQQNVNFFFGALAVVKQSLEIEARTGTKMYIAVPGSGQARIVMRAYEFLQERKSFQTVPADKN